MLKSCFATFLLFTTVPAIAVEPGFESLFDGQTLHGWKHDGNWAVVRGEITRTGKGGPLTYTQAPVPDDFELRFEWKVAKGCNSGVYYRPGQYEYQLLDNAHSPYGENPRQSAASLFFCMAPTKDVVRPHDTWNEGRILCKGSVIQHWLNGEKVVDFDYTDPRWAEAVRLISYRGTDLAKRGSHLWLQDHGAQVSFRHLRWRAVPAAEPVVSENLTPMPVPAAALAKEKARIQQLLEAKKKKPQPETPPQASWTHQEQHRFKAAEAHQGVAVDEKHFYAITNEAIGKYRKADGTRVGGWQDAPGGHIKHLNAGVIVQGKLHCAHSNYPERPVINSMEVWDTQTLQHIQTIPLSHGQGSLTWVDHHQGQWFACFAQYAKTGDPAQTRVACYDATWNPTGEEMTFPQPMIQKFGQNSASGGSFGPGGLLFVTGHDAPELYVLARPATQATFEWQGVIPISAHGQAFAWDRSHPGVLYSIDRKTHEVIVSLISQR